MTISRASQLLTPGGATADRKKRLSLSNGVQFTMHWLLVYLIALGIAQAQTQFDVVSIKHTPPGARNSGFRRASPGVFSATNVSLQMLIAYAYDIREFQISGLTGWMDTDRYEILAKSDPPGDVPKSVMRARVQAILADRFQLALHKTTKELPIFELTVAKNGPKGLKPPGDKSDLISNGHHLTCTRISIDTFVKLFLQDQTERLVVNKTGITGEYDFTMDWSPEEEAPGTSDKPSFVTALEEQLGLKLETAKGPVDILVIEHAARASEN